MPDYEKQYLELVDALCSKSWLGRNRHESVLALACRLRDGQTYIRALDSIPETSDCTRPAGHSGLCNGLPRATCPGEGPRDQ